MTAGNPVLMRRAIAIACESVAAGGGPFGALIARGDDVVAVGNNRVTSTNDPTAHAEVTAIRAACAALGRFDLRGLTLYTSCEPCPMCLGAVHWARIDRMFYAADRFDAAAAGFDDELLYREVSLPLDARTVPALPLLKPDGMAPFTAWLAKPDRTAY